MTDESDKRRRPHPYGFPFPPYHVQEALMADIYKCLDDGGVGIFESPTGTGKSLSLICSTLQWLLDQEATDAAGEAGAGASPAPTSSTGGDPSWVDEQVAATAQQERAHLHSELVERRRLRKARVAAYAAHAAASSGAAASRPGRKRLPGEPSGNSGAGPSDPDGGESEFVVDWSGGKGDGAETIDPSLLADGTEEEDECRARCRQVLYSSRTHSQLAQVIGEVKKTSLAGKVSVVTIGARKTLCINESLGGLDGARLNDACRQLREKDKEQRGVEQRERSKAAAESARRRREGLTEEADEEAGRGGCPHLRGGAARQTRLVDQILSSPLEIEECASLGRAENSCPYYAARAALDEAQLVALPYPSLLNSATRQALGVRLGGSVVLIDEAHNLIDTINEMHSVTLSARHLSECSAQLAQYEERYSGRLKPSNRTMVRRLLFVVRALRKALTPPRTAKGAAGAAAAVERIIYVNDLLSVYNLDNLNLLELKHFCEKSLIANKLQGFAEKSQRAAGPAGLVAGAGAHARDAPRVTLHPVIALLEGLAHSDKDARVLLHVEPLQPLRPPAASRPDSWLRVLHLNPATYFASILSEAHAVVLCGGTMQPFEDLRQQLFTNLPPGRLRTAAYGHVVPPERLAPVVFSTGPRGSPLSFSFGSRGAPALMDELGELLLALAATVPDGLVVFVPSFQYEAQLVARWEATGLWTKLDALKRTFREPRATADLDKVLSEYAATVAQRGGSGGGGGGGGALLLSVVGGKMSEGINFSDRLGRCVVMVGLPNANPYELTLQEKMGHLDAVHGVGAGRAYYANLCMKAVNQSIGRAIRHRADFAAIVLADARFVKPTVRSKLPAWIQRRVEAPDSFEGSMAAVRGFFARFPDP